jgi:hypothetical protein
MGSVMPKFLSRKSLTRGYRDIPDLTFIVTHFLPHLNRDAVYRILKAEGLGRLPPTHQRQR